MPSSRPISIVSTLALPLLMLLAAYPIVRKIRAQNAEKRVEVCVSFRETMDLFDSDWNSSALFFERCRLMGVRSVAVQEETLADWADDGKVSFLSRQEHEKFKSLGFSAGDLPKPSSLWTTEPSRAQILSAAIAARHPTFEGKIKARKLGGYSFIDRPEGAWEEDLDLRVGFNSETAKVLAEIGLSLVYAREEQGKGNFPDSTRVGSEVNGWLFSGISDGLAKKPMISPSFREAVQRSDSKIILLENVNAPLIQRVSADLDAARRVVKGHMISVEELKVLEPDVSLRRYVRAVSERSVRFIYFHWNPAVSVEDNLSLLRGVTQNLKSRGFIFEPVQSNASWSSKRAKTFRSAIAFLLAAAGPCAGILFIRGQLRQPENQGKFLFHAWLWASGAALLAGLFIHLLLPDTVFVNGLAAFKGVKASMVLPLFLMGILLFSSEDLRRALRHKVSVRDMLIGTIFFAILFLMIERSGNYSSAVHPYEILLRNRMEDFLTVRPRFKEFAIGHPLMILGLYLSAQYRAAGKILIWAGGIGLVSIANTYCHLHTPLAVSLLRTFHGLWLGSAIGLILVLIFRALPVRRPTPQ